MMFLRLEMHGIQNYLRKYGSFHNSGVWLNFKLTLGIIGIALIACNIPLLSPIQLFYFIFRIPIFEDVMTWYSLFLLTISAGLGLYIIGRKEFSNRAKGSKIASALLMIFGLILIVDSLAVLSLVAAFSQSDWGPPPLRTPRDWLAHSLLLAWGGLTFLSGVLWLVDGAKMGGDEVPSLKKGIELESKIKYPKDLLGRYMGHYPHNPTGVLEWHISKKMREGKTREQAIKELENIGDGTI